MPDVVVGAPGRQPGLHRQHRRGPVQRLDLGFLVDREHDGLVRRVQVQAHGIADLGFQFGVGGELERLLLERFDAPPLPDLGHGDVGDAQPFAQDPARPVGDPEFRRRGLQRGVDDVDLIDLRFPTLLRPVVQPGQTLGQVAVALHRDRRPGRTCLLHDLVRARSVRGQQHDPRPAGQPCRDRGQTRPRLQHFAVGIGHHRSRVSRE